jgi:hypothetical protein
MTMVYLQLLLPHRFRQSLSFAESVERVCMTMLMMSSLHPLWKTREKNQRIEGIPTRHRLH